MTIKNFAMEEIIEMLNEAAEKANVTINTDHLAGEVWKLKTDMERRNYSDTCSGMTIAHDAYFRAYELANNIEKKEFIVATIFMIATECLFKLSDCPIFCSTEEERKLYHLQDMYNLGMRLVNPNPDMYCRMVIQNHFRSVARYLSA